MSGSSQAIPQRPQTSANEAGRIMVVNQFTDSAIITNGGTVEFEELVTESMEKVVDGDRVFINSGGAQAV